MISINGKKLCKHCFKEVQNGRCTQCSSVSNSTKYPTALNEGEILAGRYVVGKVLGKGGFGITYLCYDSKEQKRVAVKEYLPDSFTHRNKGESMVSTYGGESEEYFKVGVKNFYEEAKMVSRFNGNPNIISVYEFFFENNTTYFVMEYLDGIDLKRYITDSGGKIPESEALYVAMKISEALMIVHSTGILHRDISPDNIFICYDGSVKLIDFGAARQVVGEASKSLSVILKQGFAPLEQYQKKGKQGPWTDIYALGATLYYAMTGEVIDDAMSRINDDEIEPKGISSEFLNVLRKMLAVKIEDRCQSTFELKERLNSLSIGMKKIEFPKDDPPVIPVKPIEPKDVDPIPKPEPKPAEPKKKSSKKVVIAAVAAVCVVTIIMGIVLSGFGGSGQDRITFTIGSYPQSIVTDQNLKNKLNQYLDKKIWYTYDYYSGDGDFNSIRQDKNMMFADVELNGEKYRGVVILKYRPQSTELKPIAANSIQDDNGYIENKCYWFRYEPLKWRVLDKEEGLLICENIIDAQPYRSLVYVQGKDTDTKYVDNACTVVANCSADTPIYTWLNNEFRNIAFSDSEMEMLVHNAKLTLYSEPVFLLTKKGATNENYGFPGEGKNDSFFNPEVSDYAKCQGVNTYKMDTENETIESADWLLAAEDWNMSSSHYYYAGKSIGVSQDWNSTSKGVRPAITINPKYISFIK